MWLHASLKNEKMRPEKYVKWCTLDPDNILVKNENPKLGLLGALKIVYA